MYTKSIKFFSSKQFAGIIIIPSVVVIADSVVVIVASVVVVAATVVQTYIGFFLSIDFENLTESSICSQLFCFLPLPHAPLIEPLFCFHLCLRQH